VLANVLSILLTLILTTTQVLVPSGMVHVENLGVR